MSNKLLFYNWSLKKILLTITDSFERSSIKILYIFLVITIVKILILAPFYYIGGSYRHLFAIGIFLFTCVILLKILLIHKKYIRILAHTLVLAGIILVFFILFFLSKNVNVIILQLISMIMLSSFFLLGRTYGIIYSIIVFSPILFLILIGEDHAFVQSTDRLNYISFQITAFLNFVTIVIWHYLYHEAYERNIFEKELLNKKLILAVKEANIGAHSKSDFLSTMSHELRTPLNSVIGMSELLIEKSNNPEQEENLKILNFSATILHSLINDILDFNKLGSDKLYLESIGVNLYTLLNDICSGLQLQAKEKGLYLDLEVDDEIKHSNVCTDPTRISQIIYNLAGNAIKFTSEGSVIIKVKAHQRDNDSIKIRFSVIDTGIGINKEQQEAIFEPFTQASSSTTRMYGGTGLGLAIVKRLLTLFNSKINLESTVGVGSSFWFDISFKRDKEPLSNSLDIIGNSIDIKDLEILVVEDNPINSLLLKKIFQKWNNIPDFTKDGIEAFEKYKSKNYDLILMDVHMPLLDGYETSKLIRSLPDINKSKVPIIALTASVSINLKEKIREAGMDDYLSKPYNSKELLKMLIGYKNKINKNA